jgi:hypothetical protein
VAVVPEPTALGVVGDEHDAVDAAVPDTGRGGDGPVLDGVVGAHVAALAGDVVALDRSLRRPAMSTDMLAPARFLGTP